MNNERLLIQEDKAGAEREIAKLESFIPILNQLQGVFESLDLGVLDEKTAVSLIVDKGNTAGEMFLTAIASDCYATGNKNKHFVKQQVEAQGKTVEDFKKEINSILEQIGSYINFSKFSYSEANRTYFVSDKSKNDIVESYKIYLTDPKEIELYSEFEKTFKAMQKLNNQLLKYKGSDTYYTLLPYFESNNYLGTQLFFNKSKVLELFRMPIRF